MSNPKFSIIIPIYNTPEKYFRECINSITAQTYGSLDILLVDDGSEEETAKLCDTFKAADGRIRVIHQLNKGVAAARNKGIEQAKGEWVLFVDADDWIEKNTLEYVNSLIEKWPCDILMFSTYKEYADNRIPMKYGLESNTIYEMKDFSTRERLYIRAMGVPNTKEGHFFILTYCWDKVYNREFLIQNNLQFPTGIVKSEDKIFILSCFEKMNSFFFTDTYLYHYRANQSSVCNKYSETADQDRIKMLEKLVPIAERMDRDLGKDLGSEGYKKVEHACTRYIFGLISDVLLLKYYHENYPRNRKTRRKEVTEFLESEIIKSSIREVRYNELSSDAKIKKFLLSFGLVDIFNMIKKMSYKSSGVVIK